MHNSDRQTGMSSFIAGAIPGLDAIEEWLRGLSGAEIRELGEVLANHNAEGLTRFHTRFQAWLDRSGRSQ